MNARNPLVTALALARSAPRADVIGTEAQAQVDDVWGRAIRITVAGVDAGHDRVQIRAALAANWTPAPAPPVRAADDAFVGETWRHALEAFDRA